MFKLYAGSLNGNTIYKESENKAELVEAYNNFAKDNAVFIVDFRDEAGNQLKESLNRTDNKTTLE